MLIRLGFSRGTLAGIGPAPIHNGGNWGHGGRMGSWTLQVNDPTMIAWLCVFGYVVAAAFAMAASRLAPAIPDRRFWSGIWIGCGLLALNKQLDVHMALLLLLRNGAEGLAAGVLTGPLLVTMAFFGAGVFAGMQLLRGFQPLSLLKFRAAASLFLLGAILVLRNTVPALSALLGFHLTTETETLWHLHVSELFEVILAAIIAQAALAANLVWRKETAPSQQFASY